MSSTTSKTKTTEGPVAGKKKNHFGTNLLQLQNQIKRDPSSYKDEFLVTYHNYESTLQVFLMKPSKANKQLADLASFLAHVAQCFSDELKSYPQQLIDMLKKYATVLNPEMRLSFCKCLMLMRSKSLIEPIPLVEVFFSLMKCPDKTLRKTLFDHMLNDIKKIKTKLKNYKLCSQVQQYVYTLTKDTHPLVAKYAVQLLVELYKKQIWNDAKTVNVIANACFSKVTKVVAMALQFFLGKDVERESENESSSDDDDKKNEQQILLGLRVGKKTRKREKRSNRALKAIRKEKKKSNKSSSGENGTPHFSALFLIYDPHDFAEKLFKLVETTNEGFEIKVAIVDVISRLIGVHSLFLSNFHTFLIRFLHAHQRDVPKFLWFAAVSSHELTPPDTVEPVLMAIANNFITERNTSEVIAVGLNAIREICARCPLAMNEDLLGDLIQYRSYKDRAVVSAAKSLIQLFREKNPQMLHRKVRGKPTEETYANQIRQYGELDVKSYIPGAEVVDEVEQENEEDEGKPRKRKHSESDEDEDEWVDVSSAEDDDEEGDEGEFETDDEEGEENSDDEDEAEENGEDNGEKSADVKLTLEEKEKKASEISTQRIFTQEDFKKIRMAQMKKKLTDKGFLKGKEKTKAKMLKIDDSDDEVTARDGLVPLSSITSINSKKKHDKESRVARIMEGREDRQKYGRRYKDPKLGKTNKEKTKNKAYMMLRHKLNKKHKRSFRDKQLALKQSLLKQKKMK